MSFSFLQSKYLKGVLSIGFLAITLVAATVFASWASPSGTGDARSMFVNRGPVTQTRTGRLNVGSGAGATALARFESTGPALLTGGFTVDAGANATSAVILGDVYVGYQGSPSAAPTANTSLVLPSAYMLNGNTTVSGSVIAGNLAHSDTNPKPVCTDKDGWLIPCVATLPVVCNDATATNYTGPYNPISNYVVDNTTCTYAISTGCFIAGTEVLLADGTTKNIENVAVGEVLMGSEQDNPVMVRYVIDYTGPIYSINGSDYFVSSTHPFMTTQGWKSFDPEGTRIESPGLEVTLLTKGDVLIKEDGKYELLEKYDYRMENRTVYNFGLNGSRDFYADGYLVHNVNLFPLTKRAEAAVEKGSFNMCNYSSASAFNLASGQNVTQAYYNAFCATTTGGGSTPTTCSDNPCAYGQVCCQYSGQYECVWDNNNTGNACAE